MKSVRWYRGEVCRFEKWISRLSVLPWCRERPQNVMCWLMTGAAGRLETWGGSSYAKPSACPYSNFPKCPLRSSLAQANLFTIFFFLMKIIFIYRYKTRRTLITIQYSSAFLYSIQMLLINYNYNYIQLQLFIQFTVKLSLHFIEPY